MRGVYVPHALRSAAKSRKGAKRAAGVASRLAPCFDGHLCTVQRGFARSSGAATVTNKTATLVSIPLSIGQPYVGPDKSPDMLKKNGLLQMLGDIGWRVEQLPDITEVSGSDMGSIDMSAVNAKNGDSPSTNAASASECSSAIFLLCFQRSLPVPFSTTWSTRCIYYRPQSISIIRSGRDFHTRMHVRRSSRSLSAPTSLPNR